mgnify:FL=1
MLMKYRFNFLLSLLALFLGAGQSMAQSSEAYGVISSGEQAGIYHYTISPQGISDVECINPMILSTELNNSDKISGGALVGDRYYYSMAHLNAQGYQSDGIYYYDLEEKTTVQLTSWDFLQQGPSCASWTYDFQNEVMYAANGFQGGGNKLLTVDLNTGELATVAEFNITEQPSWATNPENYAHTICGMAMTYDGDLYGVGYWGGLYKINTTTGDCEYIGAMKDACPNPTNGQVAFQYQGACDLVYDNDNGKMYLYMYQYPPTQYVPNGYGGIGSGYALFEVDLQTADVTYIEDTDGHHFVGNSIVFAVAEASAPQAPQELTATRGENGALSVTLEWDNPAKTYARGGTLEELDRIEIYRNGELVHTINNPEIGGHETWTDTDIPERGNYSYRLSGFNSAGQGDRASITLYVGPGNPMPVGNATATPDGANANISWSAPTEGKYESWIDTADLTYDLTRQPDNVKVAEGISATEFTDETVPAIGYYSYDIVAHAGGYDSEKASTAAVMVGPAISIPATIGFTDLNQFNLWKSYDLNGNGYSWYYSEYWPLYRPCAYVSYQYDNMAAADLLVSPYIFFEAGKHYKLTFDATMNTKNVPELLDITFAKSTELAAQDSVTEFHITPTADKQKYSLRANLPVVDKDSTYHVGFYYRSYEAAGYGVYLENVQITEDTDGYIAGTVKNEAGEPIEGALLLINGGQFNAKTDAKGEYILNYLPAGEYNIDVQALGYENQTVTATVASLETTTMDVTMTALPKHTLSGIVKDVAGDPIKNADIEVTGYNTYITTTAEDGTFEIADMFESTYYSISVTKNKYVTLQQSFEMTADLTLDLVMEDNIKAPRSVNATESEDGQSIFVEWGSPANDPRWVRFDDGAPSTYVGVAIDNERGIGGSNAVFGIVDRTPSTVFGVDFLIGATAQVSQHYSVYLRIFDLDENGEPTSNKLYENTYVSALDNEWTHYTLPAPVDAPNGYFIAISHYTFASLAIDGGAGGDAANYPFKPLTSCFSGNYQTQPFLYLDNQNEALRHNFMMRPYAAPFETDEDVQPTGAKMFCYPNHENVENQIELQAEPVTTEVAEPVMSNGPRKSVQERLRYNVYRFNTKDEADESKWTLLADHTQAQSLTDNDWTSLESGAYYYGVKAVYTGEKESNIVLADSIGNKMNTTVTFHLNTNTEENEAFGAKVQLINGGGRHYYEATADDEGNVTIENVWKTGYDVTISLDGFETVTGKYDFSTEDSYSFDLTLNEIQVKPYNLIIEDIEGQPTQKNFIWNYPDYFYESFEDHPDFEINSPGLIGWQYIDGDEAETGAVYGFSWPNLGSKMAFQVFNPYSDLAIDENGTGVMYYIYGLQPRTGQKMLTTWASYEVANNDWIITPKLHFQEDFTFRFWARCVDYQYLETFNVLYSTTDMQPESFIALKENTTAYSYYQGHSVTVPKEAKYVAIQCVSDQKRVFCIDDIEFGLPDVMPNNGYYQAPARAPRKAPALDGAYEVYLDNVKVTDTDDTNYLFENLRNGDHTAGVIASYTSGKTEMSTIDFTVDVPTGMTSVKSELKVSVDGRRLSIKGDYRDVQVYSNDGKMMRISRIADGVYNLNNLPAGVYVVNVTTANGTKSMKAAVK